MPRLKSLCGTRPAIRLITDGTGRFSSAKCEGITSMGRSSSKKLQGGAAAPAAKPIQERKSRKIADESIEHWELRVWKRGVPEVVTMLAKVFAYAAEDYFEFFRLRARDSSINSARSRFWSGSLSISIRARQAALSAGSVVGRLALCAFFKWVSGGSSIAGIA
ncbi:hypothetical protein [Planctomyces sp. SH-PL14]|uniref:hypothetical protein n=1 Tax=Planctomyces sp. SH-PL14 TaxID=1632864 RepID=UPI0012E9056E|nr:hypothetical protein [Planctomyces sp. SH-PL14]